MSLNSQSQLFCHTTSSKKEGFHPPLLCSADHSMVQTQNSNDNVEVTTTDKVLTIQSSLSEYEKLRARNIERNNKRMVALGLMSEDEALLANRKAWKKNSEADQGVRLKGGDDEKMESNASSSIGISSSKNCPINQKNKATIKNQNKNREDYSNYSMSMKGFSTNKNSRGARTDEGIRTRSRGIEKINHSQKAVVEGLRKSSRKRARMPFEAEGIWI